MSKSTYVIASSVFLLLHETLPAGVGHVVGICFPGEVRCALPTVSTLGKQTCPLNWGDHVASVACGMLVAR